MDATDSIPVIFCEAADLLTLPPISLDPVGEQVHANTHVLQTLNSTVLAIEEKISSLLSVSSVLPSSIAAGKGDSSSAAAGTQHHSSYAKAASSYLCTSRS